MKVLTLTVGLVLGIGLLANNLDAQQNRTTQQDRANQNRDLTQRQNFNRQQPNARRTPTSIVRASKLIGMEVKNAKDEDLGSVAELAIDPDTGEIAYAAVSMGGLLGVGDKMFAVPWDAIECRAEKTDEPQTDEEQRNADKVAVLDIDKETLKNAKGFNQDNWPDMANERWQQENDRLYEATRRKAEQNRRNGARLNNAAQQPR